MGLLAGIGDALIESNGSNNCGASRIELDARYRDLRQANQTIHQQNAVIADLDQKLAAAYADQAGKAAQRAALREALRQLDPNHPLLQKTGQRYSDGREQIGDQVFYENGFDAEFIRQKAGDPRRHRPVIVAPPPAPVSFKPAAAVSRGGLGKDGRYYPGKTSGGRIVNGRYVKD